jgi:hypothetical protein
MLPVVSLGPEPRPQGAKVVPGAWPGKAGLWNRQI